MSKQKQKGTLAETAVADYLKQYFPAVERRTLGGQFDKGDIAGVPNAVIEVKNQKAYKFPEWVKETETERINAGEPIGVLVVKPNGVGVSKVDQWWCLVSLETLATLLKDFDAQRLQSSSD